MAGLLRRRHEAVDMAAIERMYPPPPEYFEYGWYDTPDVIEHRRVARLKVRAHSTYQVPFFRRRWDAAGFHPSDLRSVDDRAALVEGIRDGTIAAIATDHAPHARHEKDVPFEAAPFGVTGLETAFAALYTHLVEPGLVKLELLLERMSAGPAAIFGLPAPRIAVGEPANLVLLDTKAGWRVQEDGFRSRSSNSWLLGQRLTGKVRMTVAAGRTVFEA